MVIGLVGDRLAPGTELEGSGTYTGRMTAEVSVAVKVRGWSISSKHSELGLRRPGPGETERLGVKLGRGN